jgi:hypothetical protein
MAEDEGAGGLDLVAEPLALAEGALAEGLLLAKAESVAMLADAEALPKAGALKEPLLVLDLVAEELTEALPQLVRVTVPKLLPEGLLTLDTVLLPLLL